MTAAVQTLEETRIAGAALPDSPDYTTLISAITKVHGFACADYEDITFDESMLIEEIAARKTGGAKLVQSNDTRRPPLLMDPILRGYVVDQTAGAGALNLQWSTDVSSATSFGMAMAFYIPTAAYGSNQVFYGNQAGTKFNAFWTAGGVLRFQAGTDNLDLTYDALAADTWHYVVFQLHGGVMTARLNGGPPRSHTRADGTAVGVSPMYVGAANPGSGGEVRWRAALSFNGAIMADADELASVEGFLARITGRS